MLKGIYHDVPLCGLVIWILPFAIYIDKTFNMDHKSFLSRAWSIASYQLSHLPLLSISIISRQVKCKVPLCVVRSNGDVLAFSFHQSSQATSILEVILLLIFKICPTTFQYLNLISHFIELCLIQQFFNRNEIWP